MLPPKEMTELHSEFKYKLAKYLVAIQRGMSESDALCSLVEGHLNAHDLGPILFQM